MQQKNKILIIYYRLSFILIVNFFIVATAVAQYQLRINYLDKDSTFQPQVLKLQTSFTAQLQCIEYINKLPALLNVKGYAGASIDQIQQCVQI